MDYLERIRKDNLKPLEKFPCTGELMLGYLAQALDVMEQYEGDDTDENEQSPFVIIISDSVLAKMEDSDLYFHDEWEEVFVARICSGLETPCHIGDIWGVQVILRNDIPENILYVVSKGGSFYTTIEINHESN